MAFSTEPIELFSKEEVLAAQDIEEVDVAVPQWGTTSTGAPRGVRIRTFTKRQASEMTKRATVKDKYTGKESIDNDLLEALLFTEGVIAPKFDLEDYDQLQEKSAVAISLIIRAITDASGLSESAIREATKSPEERPVGTAGISFSARVTDDAGTVTTNDVSEGVRLLDRVSPT